MRFPLPLPWRLNRTHGGNRLRSSCTPARQLHFTHYARSLSLTPWDLPGVRLQAGTGTVTKGEFEQGMKKMAIAFSPEELQLVFDMVDTANGVDYKAFCDQFCVTFMETIGGRSSYANATGRYFKEAA